MSEENEFNIENKDKTRQIITCAYCFKVLALLKIPHRLGYAVCKSCYAKELQDE